MKAAIYALLASPILALHALAATTTEVDTGHVRAQLIASSAQVHPGEQITLGVHQRIIEHWHTYWLNPGDSGLATTITWTLPPGATAGAVQWPVPHRFTQGPVTNYGYEHAVTLLTPITVPKDAQVGRPLTLSAQVNWLVCRDICIPQSAQLTLSLPVIAAGQAAEPGNPLIDEAKALLPVAAPWPVQAALSPDGLSLRLPAAAQGSAPAKEIWFYPEKWGQVDHHADQPRRLDGQDTLLLLRAGEAPLQAGQALNGVLVIAQGEGEAQVRKGYTVSADVQVAPHALPTTTAPAPVSAKDPAPLGLGTALVLALLGGLILNLMPCVFPVLSIKALSLLNHADQTPAQARLHGIAYTAGVLTSFALLAGLLIALKAGGEQVGWGFQFQSPVFVLAVAYLMFAVGLSLSGVFTMGASVTGLGSSLANRAGYAGSFFTGVLATVVATPCTAPFMGGAIGFALSQPPLSLLAVFLSLGLGLALPYLLLSVWPPLQRRLPRPGIWMERVKQALAFPMYAAAAWLVWVLTQQAGANAVAIALAGLVAIAFGAWVYDSSRTGGSLTQHGGAGIATLALASALAGGYWGLQATSNPPSGTAASHSESAGNWEAYTPERLADLRSQGKPVFVNLTAAWCITCLVNERVALRQAPVVKAFQTSGIHYLKGDWTNQDPAISKLLAQFGRSGVPLYVLYANGTQAKPLVLPQILTPDIVLAAVQDAAMSTRSN